MCVSMQMHAQKYAHIHVKNSLHLPFYNIQKWYFKMTVNKGILDINIPEPKEDVYLDRNIYKSESLSIRSKHCNVKLSSAFQ